MKPWISTGLVALATALSTTLSLASAVAGVWPLVFIHLFIAMVLLGATFRLIEVDAQAEVQRQQDQAKRFVP